MNNQSENFELLQDWETMRVLAIDDKPLFCTLLKTRLAELGKLRTRYDAIGMTLPSLPMGAPVRARSAAEGLNHHDDDFIQKAIA